MNPIDIPVYVADVGRRARAAARTTARAATAAKDAARLAAAAALLWLGLRSLLWIPATAAIGAIALAAWASVPWLPAVLGLALAAAILGALAWALRWAIREWRESAAGHAAANPEAKAAADVASLKRQPKAVRPLISALLQRTIPKE
jgi:protein-S-isoprenylcysteine O-methyltransferase Ste14